MKVLLTTPNGKVGMEVAKLLLARGETVRLGAHTPKKASQAFPNAKVVHLDYGDTKTLDAAVQGVAAIYLASPGGSPSAPELHLIDAAKTAGVTRIVKLSAMGVENGESPLRDVEKHLEGSGLEWTVLRPSWFMQNFSTIHAGAIRNNTWTEPAGTARTAFIDARDIAEAAVAALTQEGHAGKIYTLTGPELLDRNEVAGILSRELGRTVKYLAISDEQFRIEAKRHMQGSYVDLLSALYAGVRAGWYDKKTDTVKHLLGREPGSFARFAHDHRAVWMP